jgi:hypothetical protein
MKKNKIDKNRVPNILAIGKMMNGLLSESSSTMVLPLGQRMSLGVITPLYVYAQPHHQIAGCC